ncbi:MAG: GNAT family N-acetyltransferase [Pseudomonadota bacterium]
MSAAELDEVLGWAAVEGWNPGFDDAAAFYAADPDGFFVAEVEGVPVASISVVNHSEHFAFLGLYICLPAFRGQGIGFALWQQAMAHAGGRVVGLDGVPDQQANYARSGFVHEGETRRFEGVVPALASTGVRPVVAGDVEGFITLLARREGVEKAQFLRAWLTETATRASFCLPGGSGVVTRRRCGRGTKIGPLSAATLEAAEVLLRHAAVGAEGPLVVDVPGDQPGLARLCERWGMEVSFGTARMYRGAAPQPGPGVWSVATLELG